MRCVLVSKRLDLRGYLGAEIARIAPHVEVIDHTADPPGARLASA
jgi:glyoxylate/hydroxypyruvate reductase A